MNKAIPAGALKRRTQVSVPCVPHSPCALLKAINGPKQPVRKTPSRWEILLEMAADDLLPVRPNRREPRAIKRRPKNYQRLTAPRSLFQEVPHRHRTKKRLN